MTDALDTALLKSLFARLVKAHGSHDAAAVRLDVTRQRIGQLCSASDDHAKDVPTWGQVWTLEQSLGRSVVFAALAGMVEPSGGSACAIKETHDLVLAVAAMCPVASALDPAKPDTVRAFADAFDKVQREAADVQAIANVVPMRGAK